MSLFLGHIHFWLYRKIEIEQGFENYILENFKDEELERSLDSSYKKLPVGSLEEIVDTSNIHESLQGFIDLVENRLAFILGKLLGQDENNLEKIYSLAYEYGRSLARDMEIEKNRELGYYYAILNDIYLTGMPCSRGSEIVEDSHRELIFNIKKSIYRDYYKGLELESAYKEIKVRMGNGLLNSYGLEVVNLEDEAYLLRRI